MTRLVFGGDDVTTRGSSGTAILAATGQTARVYLDGAGTTLADISLTSGGGSIVGSTLTIDAFSRIPVFYGPPNGTDTLYVTVNSGPLTAIYARPTDRIDANAAAITAEATRATTAEGTNAAAITAEATRATTAEGTNATAITAEATRATTAEATKIDTAGTGLVKSGTTIKRAPSTTGYANLAALPAAASSNAGLLVRTADGGVYESDGAAWQIVHDPSGTSAAVANAAKITGPWTFRTPPTVRGRITTIDPVKARARNALAPLTVPSVDGTGENVEPCVLYLPEGFTDGNGATWRYLMVKAGYHNNTASLENPALVVSNDGRTWVTVANCPDPLVANPGGGVHNYDQSITIGPDGTIYVLYMQSDDSTFESTYFITTTDLVHWTTPTLLRTSNSLASREQAPVAQWDGSQWHVWTVQFVPANPSGILHYAGASIAAAIAGTGTACTIVNQPTTPTVLWEHNIIRVGEQWVGVISGKTGANCSLYFMTSPDGLTWTMGKRPVLQPQAVGQGSLWDKGLIYRSGIALLDTGRGGIRFGLWYNGASSTGTATWGIGYTEIWLADAEAPRGSYKYPAAPSRYYINPIITALTTGTLTQNNLFVYVAYSGEIGLLVNGLDLTPAVGVPSAVMRGGLYIANDQSNPYNWAAGTAWGQLVSELASTFDCSVTTHQPIRWAGTQNLWVPPRTWFGIGGASQGAAANVNQGKISNTGWSPFGSAGAGYNTTPAVCLFSTGVSGALPQNFTPTGVAQVDNGLGYILDASQPT